MIRRVLALVLCATALPCVAAEPISADWPSEDVQLLGAAIGVMAIDWGQTRDIARRPIYHEVNPLLPRNPTQQQVNRYFTVAMIATAGLAYALPTTYRRYFLGGVLLVETVVVLHNHRIGLRVDF